MPEQPADCNIVLIVLRGTIGSFDENRPSYISNTAYELETSLNRTPGPKVFVFRDASFQIRTSEKIWNLSSDKIGLEIEKARSADESHKALLDYLDKIKKGEPRLNIMPFDNAKHLIALVNDLLHKELSDAVGRLEIGKVAPKHRFEGNPFRSFRSLTEFDSQIFFGREADVEKILARLQEPETRFVCIKGRSGTGKSSLLQAGILPPLLYPKQLCNIQLPRARAAGMPILRPEVPHLIGLLRSQADWTCRGFIVSTRTFSQSSSVMRRMLAAALSTAD